MPIWTLPVPSSGSSGVPASEQESQDALFYGVDIWFDVAAADPITGQANYVISPAGDFTIVTGREALRQSLIRRTITSPDEWKLLPDYGCGARQYVKAKNTAARRAELETRIRAQYLRDKRVLRVDTATVTPLSDGSAGIRISVIVTPRGRLRDDQPLPVLIEVR